MTKDDILEELTERDLILGDKQHIILVDGFENAFLGVTVNNPIKAIYDYWKCLDLLIHKEKMEYDDAVDYLDEFLEQDLGVHTPTYMKSI